MSRPTAVSLFAGVEGIGLAFCRAGFRVVAAVEIDHAARGVIADRMPDTALFTDVCEVTADELLAAGFDPRDGVLLAGWPCADLSVAGRRLGLGGPRSGLFWQVVRLLDGLRPRWFCLENVPGLLSAVCCCPGAIAVCGDILCCEPHPVRGGACGYRPATGGRCMQLHGGAMGAVVGALAELGYGLAYRVLDAQYFGVPQRRRRIVIVGCAGDWAAPVQVLLEPEGGAGDPAPGAAAGPRAAGVAALSASDGGADDNDATGGRLIAHETGPGWWGTGPATGTLRAAGDQDATVVVGPLQAAGTDGRGHRIDTEGAATGHLVAATLTAGSHTTRPPGRRAEDEVNLVPTVAAKWAKGTGGPAGDEAQNLIAFDAAQITHPQNRVNPQPGDPAMPLAAAGRPHIAYTVHGEHSTAMTSDGLAPVARPADVVRSLDTTGGYATNQGGTVVAYTVRAEPGGSGNGHNTTDVTQPLTAEAADTSETGTDRTTPLVPVSLAVAQDLATGADIAMPVTGSHGQPGTVAVPLDLRNAARTSEAGTTAGTGLGQDGDASFTLSATTRAVPGVATTTAVRRLTPLECERLQGLPDGWTATSWGKPQSDSARYRQLGNAVAVPVFHWVARRIRWQASHAVPADHAHQPGHQITAALDGSTTGGTDGGAK